MTISHSGPQTWASGITFHLLIHSIFNCALVSPSVKWGSKIVHRFARESKGGENAGNVSSAFPVT